MAENAVKQLFAELWEGWRPPTRLSLSEWADEHAVLSAESAAEPGRWRTLPYQRGIMDAISDPSVEQVWVMKSARVGYTKIFGHAIGYYIHHDPCPIMVVQPTVEDAEGYSKEEIAPMLRDTPVLREIVPESKSRDGQNTILNKQFPGGSLSLVGANSPRGFRRVSRRVVIFDEVDGYPPSAGSEGDQIKLGIRRTEYYWNRKIIGGSTPTIAGYSRIERQFERGDRRYFRVPCPHCDHADVLVFSENRNERGHFMRWDAGKPETAHFVCRACGGVIEHRHKRWMIEEADRRQRAGEEGIGWVAEGEFKGIASFHVWAAYSYSPNATWADIASEFEEANAAGAGELQTFVNTVLGEAWHDRGEAPDWERLFERREAYPIGRVPKDGLLLVAGVDVQGGEASRLECEVVAYGRGKRSWSVEYHVFPGDVNVPGEGAWRDLDALLDKTYTHETGAQMRIAMLAVDSGFNTQVVYDWCRRHPADRVMAVRGVPTAKVLLGSPSQVDITSSGRKIRRGGHVWPVGVNIAKSELYGWLRLKRPADDEPYPPGYCHFPEYDEKYFKGLASEQLVPVKKKGGYVVREWELIPGRRNEPLDCRNYARAAAARLGIDRFEDVDWDTLEAELGAASASRTSSTDDSAGGGYAQRRGWLKR